MGSDGGSDYRGRDSGGVMIITLLDKFIETCGANKNILPVFNLMDRTLKAVTPVCHRWQPWPDVKKCGLPNTTIIWPDPAFCLCSDKGIYQDRYIFCVDIDYDDLPFVGWFGNTDWRLDGILVFQPDAASFDVIPLTLENTKRIICIPEIQLHYVKTDDGWTWYRAATGPVNGTFYDHFMDLIQEEDHPIVETNIALLGSIIDVYLGSYCEWLAANDGAWDIHPGKPPKVKLKKDRVVKIHKPGTVGWKEYIKESIDE